MNFDKRMLLEEKKSIIKEAIASESIILRILDMIIENPNIEKEIILKELNIKKSQYYKYLLILKNKYGIEIKYLITRKSNRYRILLNK